MKNIYGKTSTQRKAEQREKERIANERVQMQREKEAAKAARREKREQRIALLNSGTPESVMLKKMRMQKFVILMLIGVFAIVSILTAVMIALHDPYKGSLYPVAEIRMSDGRKMAFQLFYDEAPNAVAWFFFYAQNEYYNKTIIDTVKNDTIKMGGYEESKEYNKDSATVKMLKSNSEFNNTNTFAAYMKDDTAAVRPINHLGVLSTIFLDIGSDKASSAEFQICTAEAGTEGIMPTEGRAFGEAFDQKTKEHLRYYRTLSTTPEGYVTTAALVMIDKINFYALGSYEPPDFFVQDVRNGYYRMNRYS